MKTVLTAVAAVALSTSAAFAADLRVKAPPPPPPSPWDLAFGSALMTDYNWRGVSQSNRKPSVAAYFEPRYNISPNMQFYAGIAGESISFPNRAAAEIDFYGGVRPTFGPIALDLGFWYYYYPGGQCFNGAVAGCLAALPNTNVIKDVMSFWEVYGKAAYTISDALAVGAGLYYTPSWMNMGANGTYLAGNAKYTLPASMLPGIGTYISGELGHYWLGTTDAFYGIIPAFPAGINLPDYMTWNIGVGFTWKVFTLDLRYYDTDLSRGDCNALTSDHTASGTTFVTPINPGGLGSRWCNAAFIAKLSADLTLGNLK